MQIFNSVLSRKSMFDIKTGMLDTRFGNDVCLQIVDFIIKTIYLFSAEHW